MEKGKGGKQIWATVYAVCVFSILLVIQPVRAADMTENGIRIDTDGGRIVNLVVNKLAKIKSPAVIKRAHIVNPKIAELIYSKTQSPNWVFVSGKAVGTTQLTLWGRKNKLLGTFEIIVGPDAAGLKKNLYEIFPEENVAVRASGSYLTLT
ncbi:MAG: hypothetical protein D3910_07870, partial [Candidatus Electrothrix sp. ATG2]|nr:hypothetical protein [Candidatus Electrothrix sp. ATG2]